MEDYTNADKAMDIAYDVARQLQADVKIFDDTAVLTPLRDNYKIILHFEHCAPDYDSGCGVPERPEMTIEFAVDCGSMTNEDKATFIECLNCNVSKGGKFLVEEFSYSVFPEDFNCSFADIVSVDNPSNAVSEICNIVNLWEKNLKQTCKEVKE